MTIPIVKGSFPSVPISDPSISPEVRIEQLENALRSLIGSLDGYAFFPQEYAEEEISSLDDVKNGVTYARVKVGNVDLDDGTIKITAAEVSGVEDGADKTSTHTSEDTAKVYGRDANDIREYSERAGDGLDSDGYANLDLKRIIKGTGLTTGAPDADGLWMTSTYVGFFDKTTDEEFKIFMSSTGIFYAGTSGSDSTLDGDSGSYMYFNPTTSTIKIRADYGFLGNATTFFNITDGKLQLYDADGRNAYTYAEQGIIGVYSAASGSTPYVELKKEGVELRRRSVSFVSNIFIKSVSDSTMFYAAVSGASGAEVCTFSCIYDNSGDADIPELAIYTKTNAYMKNIDIDRCDIGQTTAGKVQAAEYKSYDGSAGVSGWFDDGTNFRITTKNGLVTTIANSSSAGHG